MKFESKKIDADLELTTLTGANIVLSPAVNSLSSKETARVLKIWTKRDEVNLAEETPASERFTIQELFALDLADIYPAPANKKNWWLENFDPMTIKSIFEFVGKALAGQESAGN